LTEDEKAKQYPKELIKTALDKGISPVDLLSSLIMEPEETVKEYLPDLDKKIDVVKKEGNVTEFLSSVDKTNKQTVKAFQSYLNKDKRASLILKESLGLEKEQIGIIQEPTHPQTAEDAIKIRLEELIAEQKAQVDQVVEQTITELIKSEYTLIIRKINDREQEICTNLKKIEKTYSWVFNWSKALFYFGLVFVLLAVGLSLYGAYTFFNTFNQLPNYIAISALFATSTLLPVIFTSLPTLFTSIPWQQIIAAAGVLGGTGLTSIVTTFIKGAFQEVSDSSVDLTQTDLILDIYDNKIKKPAKDFHLKTNEILNINTNSDEKKKILFLNAVNEFKKEETTILEDLLKKLQDYLKTPIKTEASAGQQGAEQPAKPKKK
jgi:hypothetical protein